MIPRLCILALTLPALLLLGGCGASSGLWGDDEFDRYAQRLDTITDSAGNAKEANRAIHTDHPWPRYAFDRRIPVDSSRMSNAVRNYRSGPAPAGVQAPTGATAESPTQPQPGGASPQAGR